MRDETYKLLIEDWGEPTDSRVASPAILDKYRGVFPDEVIGYWQEEGFCQFKHGLYYTVNPDDWQPVVDAWITETPYEQFGRFYALTRTAFGTITLFNHQIGAAATIRPHYGQITSYKTELVDDKGRGLSCAIALTPSPANLELYDVNEKPLTDRAVRKFGPCGWDEMYAFEPALALGGQPRLENLVKLDWRVHLMLLRQIAAPHVPHMDVKLPPGVV